MENSTFPWYSYNLHGETRAQQNSSFMDISPLFFIFPWGSISYFMALELSSYQAMFYMEFSNDFGDFDGISTSVVEFVGRMRTCNGHAPNLCEEKESNIRWIQMEWIQTDNDYSAYLIEILINFTFSLYFPYCRVVFNKFPKSKKYVQLDKLCETCNFIDFPCISNVHLNKGWKNK